MAVILRYIYVLRAEQRLAVTCVREVVALMEFYTWQPSRLHWYVFKILSRNKTCFCCLLGQVSGAFFCLLCPPGGPGDSTGRWWHSKKEGVPNDDLLLKTQMKGHKEVFIFIKCGCTFTCIYTHSVKANRDIWILPHKTCTHTLWHTHSSY